MKRIWMLIIVLSLVLLFGACGTENVIDDAPDQTLAEPTATSEIPVTEKTDAIVSYMSVDEFGGCLLDELNTRYEAMMYRVDISKQLSSLNLEIVISVDVNGTLETTGAYVRTNVDSNDSLVDEVKFVVFRGTPTIYFDNGLTALLHTCDLGLSEDRVKDIVDSYAGVFADGKDTYSGITEDGYSIFMEKTDVDYGLTAYVVTIKF